jgi:hypothetical protein
LPSDAVEHAISRVMPISPLGGEITVFYAAAWPDEVAGMTFVEPCCAGTGAREFADFNLN